MKRNKDYIPTYSEIEAERVAAAARAKDTRKMYKCTYVVDGTQINEMVAAYDTKEAIEHINQQCGMVGWIPRNLTIVDLEETNTKVK